MAFASCQVTVPARSSLHLQGLATVEAMSSSKIASGTQSAIDLDVREMQEDVTQKGLKIRTLIWD